MEGFEVTKIGKHIFCILDAGNSSFYMVEGDEKAAVIDTGITTGKKIMPLLRELTDKPLLLVATHVHWDHIYHMDEFEEVYIGEYHLRRRCGGTDFKKPSVYERGKYGTAPGCGTTGNCRWV